MQYHFFQPFFSPDWLRWILYCYVILRKISQRKKKKKKIQYFTTAFSVHSFLTGYQSQLNLLICFILFYMLVWGFLVVVWFVCLVWFFKTESHHVALACVGLKIFLPQSSKCWDYRHMPSPCLARFCFIAWTHKTELKTRLLGHKFLLKQLGDLGTKYFTSLGLFSSSIKKGYLIVIRNCIVRIKWIM